MTGAEKAPLDGVIDSLLVDLEERFRCRAMKDASNTCSPEWELTDEAIADHAMVRTEDVRGIRGLVRAIRVLRAEEGRT